MIKKKKKKQDFADEFVQNSVQSEQETPNTNDDTDHTARN